MTQSEQSSSLRHKIAYNFLKAMIASHSKATAENSIVLYTKRVSQKSIRAQCMLSSIQKAQFHHNQNEIKNGRERKGKISMLRSQKNKDRRSSSLRQKIAYNFLQSIVASHSKAITENSSHVYKNSITKQVSHSPVHNIINSKSTVSSQSQSIKTRNRDSKVKKI